MDVGKIKITVSVGVGVSVGVLVGGGVIVGVLVGGGSKMAVCVRAAATVPAMTVSRERGSASDDAGADRTGSSHASKKSNVTNQSISFLAVLLSISFNQEFHLTSMTNFTAQKSFLPTRSDHMVE